MRIFLSLFTAIVISINGYTQTSLLDSLKTKITTHPAEDTIKVQLFNAVSSNAWGFDPKITKDYAQKALTLAQKLNYTKGIADSYREISRYYWTQTEYDKSTDFALMALRQYELCNDLNGIAACYGVIGTSYSQANNYNKAIYYHKRALALNTRLNNKSGIGKNLNSLGYVSELQKNFQKALQYYKKGLEIRLEVRNKADITLSYANVGSIYCYLKNYPLSLKYLFKSLPLAKEINNKNYIALIYQNIGEVYYKVGKFNEGEIHLKNALRIGNEIGDKKRREGVYEALKSLEESRHNYKAAFHYLELLQAVRDTLYTQERSRQMARMETLYETDKKEQTIKIMEQEHRMQMFWRNALTVGIILAAFVAIIIYKLQRSRMFKARELLLVQQSLNSKLTEVDKMKSHFFANISHEFRTPLTLLLAPIEEKLSTPTLTQTEKESLLLMRRNAYRLLDLVNQLLDLSKLEAGKMKLNIKDHNLNDFLKILTASFDSLSDYKKIYFIKKICLVNDCYRYDADVMEKILNNLLSNAFKFTPSEGTIILSVTSEYNILKITVTDTGKGIPKEEQTEIFSPFYQARNTSEDGQLGTGLGLSLVKELSRLHGGSIDLQSEENEGTSITISIPVENTIDQSPEGFHSDISKTTSLFVDENQTHHSPEVTLDEQHKDLILVVEDNDDLRKFISDILQREFNVISAANGKQGVEEAFLHIPSLIISDFMMPEWDGVMLTEKIKSDERTSHIPIIILTAKNEQESRLDGFKAGADDYLAKPFSTEELNVRIKNLIEQRKLLAAKYKEKINVLPTPSNEVSLDEKFLQRVKASVENNISDCSFCVERMADEVNLSRTQLLRKLKALTGFSPNEFIRDFRLKKAMELIQSNTDTISQIGYQVGFNDQSYFTKCFKKQYGMLPSEYSHKGVK